MQSQLDKLAIEDVTESICKINYGGFILLMNKSNMFVNVTPLCKLAGKEMNHWLENKSSKDLINTVYYYVYGTQRKELSRNSSGSNDVIYKVMDGPNDLRGTYVHPLLLHSICMWLSPVQHLKMLPLITKLTQDITVDFSTYIPNKKILSRQTESQWRDVVIDWSNISKSTVEFQRQLDKYKIDLVVDSAIAVEFDENDHSGYNHVNDILRTKKILSQYRSLIRFSDSRWYDVKMIDFVIKYVQGLQISNGVVHVNYKPEKVIRIDLLDNSISVVEITTDESE